MTREDQIKKAAEIIAYGCSDELKEALIKDFPELKESEDERIRKALLELVSNDKNNGYTEFYKAEGITCDDAIAYLEKLKEFQFGYPGIYFYDGEKLHFQGNPVMEEKQKEQKPAEKQDYSGLTELERVIHRGFLCAGVENVPVEIIKETAQECLAQMRPAETSNIDLDTKVNDWVGYMLNDNAQSYSRKNVQIMLDNCARFFYDYAVMCLDKSAEWSAEDENKIESIKGLITMGKFVDTNTIRTIWKVT